MPKIEELSEDECISYIQQCDNTIRELERTLPMLENYRRFKVALGNRLCQLRGTPTIHHLDLDILVRIFKHVQMNTNHDSNSHNHGYNGYNHGWDVVLENHYDSMGILPILGVCRRWRKLVLATPILWSYISFDIAPDVDLIARQTRYAHAAIHHSGKELLSVELRLPSEWSLWAKLANDLVKQMTITNDANRHANLDVTREAKARKVAEYFERVFGLGGLDEDLEAQEAFSFLHNPIDEAISNLIRTIVGGNGKHMDRLRSLKLIFFHTDFEGWSLNHLFNYHAPNLEYLTLIERGGTFQIPIQEISLPFATNLIRLVTNYEIPFGILLPYDNRLTRLRFCPNSSQVFEQFLAKGISLGNLVCLSIKLHYQWTPQYHQSHPLELPNLQELTFEAFAPAPAPTPGLDRCIWQGYRTAPADPILNLNPAFWLKAPNLITLRFINIFCDQYYRFYFCNPPQFPSIEELHVWAPTPYDQLDISDEVSSYTRQLPYLRELAFIHDSCEEGLKQCINGVTVKDGVIVRGYTLTLKEYLEYFDTFGHQK